MEKGRGVKRLMPSSPTLRPSMPATSEETVRAVNVKAFAVDKGMFMRTYNLAVRLFLSRVLVQVDDNDFVNLVSL